MDKKLRELHNRIDNLNLLFNMTTGDICPLCNSKFNREEFKQQYHELMLKVNELDSDYQHIEYTINGKLIKIIERD